MTNTEAKVRRYYCSDETGKLTTQPTKHGWHRVFVLESDHDAAIAALRREVERLRKDAAWGAHNGPAHTLIKSHHADAMKLYAALKLVRPNHPLVEEYRTAYCEIFRSSPCGQESLSGKAP